MSLVTLALYSDAIRCCRPRVHPDVDIVGINARVSLRRYLCWGGVQLKKVNTTMVSFTSLVAYTLGGELGLTFLIMYLSNLLCAAFHLFSMQS